MTQTPGLEASQLITSPLRLCRATQCIRDSLTTTRRCPSCDEPAKEADLRRERALEACAEAWMEAR